MCNKLNSYMNDSLLYNLVLFYNEQTNKKVTSTVIAYFISRERIKTVCLRGPGKDPSLPC